MQMQMQQYQEQMQMQIRAQENSMQRQRVISGLTQEMQGLQIRIQCVASGANCGGNYLGSGISSGFGGSAGGSGSLIPQTGAPGGGFTPVPGTNPGSNSGGGYVR